MAHLLTTIGPCLLLTMAAVTRCPASPGPPSALASYSRLPYSANAFPARSSSTSTYRKVYRKQQRGLKEIKSK